MFHFAKLCLYYGTDHNTVYSLFCLLCIGWEVCLLSFV